MAVRIYQISAQVGRGFAAELAFAGAPTFAIIGESTAEGQAAQGGRELAANQVLAQRYTAVAGQVVSLSAYVASGSGTMRMGLYADSGGEAGALLGTTEARAVSASTGGWETFAFASPVPVSDGDYWIAVHADAELGSRGPDSAAVTTGRRSSASPTRAACLIRSVRPAPTTTPAACACASGRIPSATSFVAGDRLGIVNEDPADATLAGVSLTFAGTRGS